MRQELNSVELARRVRCHVLRMVTRAKASHVGSCLSVVDILAVLYADVLRLDPANPADPARDVCILSKGHAAAALYAVLAQRGFFPLEWLDRYCQDGFPLAGHAHSHGVPGVEVSTGSLGHGLPIGIGVALAAKADGRNSRVVVVLSDGECDEGSNWESALYAPQHKLDNLTVVIDHNKIQSYGRVEEVLDLAPFADKWRAFRWAVREVNGHNHAELLDALTHPRRQPGQPAVIIAHTIKGKGISFMEDKLLWHYRNPTDEQLAAALGELGETP